jgi:hypothetical protein
VGKGRAQPHAGAAHSVGAPTLSLESKIRSRPDPAAFSGEVFGGRRGRPREARLGSRRRALLLVNLGPRRARTLRGGRASEGVRRARGAQVCHNSLYTAPPRRAGRARSLVPLALQRLATLDLEHEGLARGVEVLEERHRPGVERLLEPLPPTARSARGQRARQGKAGWGPARPGRRSTCSPV